LGTSARIYLYHIPPIAIVGIAPSLAARLHAEFPEQIVGIKDSSGEWDNTRLLLDIDGMIVYPGSELPLIDALDLGSPGCISATANLNAQAIAEVIDAYDRGDMDAARDKHQAVKKFRLIFQDYAPIPAQKRILAIKTGDARWANVRPPLTSMPDDEGRKLVEILQREFALALDSI
jgi:4-hydroxy-tetrahydrodipicolinate synthase